MESLLPRDIENNHRSDSLFVIDPRHVPKSFLTYGEYQLGKIVLKEVASFGNSVFKEEMILQSAGDVCTVPEEMSTTEVK